MLRRCMREPTPWRTNNASAATPAWSAVHSGAGSVVSAIAVAASTHIVGGVPERPRYKTADALSPTPTFFHAGDGFARR